MMDPSSEIVCERCGKSLYVGREPSFDCPYCGAVIVVAKYENETAEDRCRRLEREVERAKLREQIESQSSTDWFWGSPLAFFSGWDRTSARAALERGDFDAARKYIEAGERKQDIGCLLKILIPIAVILAVALSRR